MSCWMVLGALAIVVLEGPGNTLEFRCILGCLWGVSRGPPWRHVCDFSLIWDVEMGGGFQVHLFSDPGMEMMTECSGCMCLNHSKNNGF